MKAHRGKQEAQQAAPTIPMLLAALVAIPPRRTLTAADLDVLHAGRVAWARGEGDTREEIAEDTFDPQAALAAVEAGALAVAARAVAIVAASRDPFAPGAGEVLDNAGSILTTDGSYIEEHDPTAFREARERADGAAMELADALEHAPTVDRVVKAREHQRVHGQAAKSLHTPAVRRRCAGGAPVSAPDTCYRCGGPDGWWNLLCPGCRAAGRACGICGELGHRRRNCPRKGTEPTAGERAAAETRRKLDRLAQEAASKGEIPAQFTPWRIFLVEGYSVTDPYVRALHGAVRA